MMAVDKDTYSAKEKINLTSKMMSGKIYNDVWDESTRQHNIVCKIIESRRTKMITCDDDQALRKYKLKQKLQAKIAQKSARV